MSTLGLFNTSNWAPNQLKKSFATRLLTRYPGTPAMLTALSAKFKQTDISAHRHHWSGKTMVFSRGVLTANLPVGTTGQQMQINVDDATTFVPGAVIRANESNEQMYVVSILGPQALLVRRQFGMTSAAPLPAGTIIWQVGNAYEEGSLRPLAKAYSQEEWDNITQIFRNSWALTGTVEAENPVTGQKISVTNKTEAAHFHAIEMELAYLFGERHSSIHNGQPIRTMDGLISQLRQRAPNHVHYAGNSTTFEQLSDMVDPVFTHSSDMTSENDRLLFVGNTSYKTINALGRANSGQINSTQSETKFGMQFTDFMTDIGNFKVVKHPLFNLNPEWASMALVVDPSALELAFLRRTTHRPFNSNVNSSGESDEGGMDALGGTFTTEVTMANYMPESGAVIYNLCQAAFKPMLSIPGEIGQALFEACLTINAPCSDGPVNAGSTVFLSITGAKPGSVVQIAAPSGLLPVTINLAGAGTVNYTMPVAPGVYTFAVIADPAIPNISWTSPIVMACVADCVQVKVESSSVEPTTCEGVTTPSGIEVQRENMDVVTGVGSTQS